MPEFGEQKKQKMHNKCGEIDKMVNTTKAMESQYITADLVESSKTKKIAILDQGEYVKTDYGDKLSLPVQIDGKDKTWRPNRDSVKNLSRAWGEDSQSWVGKIAYLSIITIQGKNSVIAVPSSPESKPIVEETVKLD